MRHMVYKFLGEMFKDNPITKRSYSVAGYYRDVVIFVDGKSVNIFESHTYHDGTHADNMNDELLGKIMNYFNCHKIVARAYVLDWCRENYKEEVLL